MQTLKTIKIGEGIDNIILGEHKSVVLKGFTKSAYTVRTFHEEAEEYEYSGYSIKKMRVFQMGFDEAYMFKNLKKYPIFKMYFKDEKLMFIIFSSYSVKENVYQSFELDNHVRFLDSLETVLQKMGKYEKHEKFREYDCLLKYHKKGLELIFDEDQLRVIEMFKPIEN
jgi:hypothetical protein